MNIQQLEYIIAVDNLRHFAKAAAACFVTQPTLSMMIQKLEEELGVKIFDRSSHPVEITAIGKQIIEQARTALKNIKQIKELVENEQDMTKGTFRLGIIPTIAPYIVPVLLEKQHDSSNEIHLIIQESTTSNLIQSILNGTLDGGLLAGPLHHSDLVEYPVYYEQFFAYVSPKDKMYGEKEIDLEAIDIHHVWLLENIHCFRGQIERLCQMKKDAAENNLSVRYEAGSIDTLIHIVDHNQGITIIPEMSAMGLNEDRQENLRTFKDLTPVREVSLVVSKEYIRKAMLNRILNMISDSVPKSMKNSALKEFVVDL